MKQPRSQKTDIAVVGAGAAGLMAAITAAAYGASVSLLDKNTCVGRKLLSTGNGRCNFTNTDQRTDCYHSDTPSLAKQILDGYPVSDILSFFDRIGVFPMQRNGYYYPFTNAAKDVRDCLSNETDRQAITKYLSSSVCNITRDTDNGFLIEAKDEESSSFILKTKCCILATGGLAFPKSGSTGDGYHFARHFGHHIKKPLPALTELKCKEPFFKTLKGIRLAARVRLFVKNRQTAMDTGEIQLTASGISGIPVFNVSHSAIRGLDQGDPVIASLSFLPMLTLEETITLLTKRFFEHGTGYSLLMSLRGLFAPALGRIILKQCRLKETRESSDLSPEEVRMLSGVIQDFRVTISGSGSFEKAQTTAGGVSLKEIDPFTMESKKMPGLFLCGELLDVDGICGGYNLTFAWASGHLAGKGAARQIC